MVDILFIIITEINIKGDCTPRRDTHVLTAVVEREAGIDLVNRLRGCVTNPLSLWERVRVRAFPCSAENGGR